MHSVHYTLTYKIYGSSRLFGKSGIAPKFVPTFGVCALPLNFLPINYAIADAWILYWTPSNRIRKPKLFCLYFWNTRLSTRVCFVCSFWRITFVLCIVLYLHSSDCEFEWFTSIPCCHCTTFVIWFDINSILALDGWFYLSFASKGSIANIHFQWMNQSPQHVYVLVRHLTIEIGDL